MIIEKEFKKLVHQLMSEEVAHISLGYSDITVHVIDDASKVSLSSVIYFGGNFISNSVRNSLYTTPLFENNHIKTTLNINEEFFTITLHFLGGLTHLNKKMFINLLEDFSALADHWRHYLDERDKEDLVHIHIPK